MAALTDDFVPQPTQASPSSPTSYSPPSNADLAAVVATVGIVGILMALLITWLVVRLRRAANSQSDAIPVVTRRPASNVSYIFRPSFAPSEASSKFGFIRKPLRLSHRRANGSWDFADPDPITPKESPLDPLPRSPSQKRRPAPLAPTPAYTPRSHRASTHKDELGPRTPTTPADCVESPPPAYCRENNNAPWMIHQPKDKNIPSS